MKPENYLRIAELVLEVARRPLSARAIMEAAHRGGIVPRRFYGKTQHKTLQARLSEDILRHRLESRFFRTNPGQFFLSRLRSDPTIPDDYKDPFHARRRTRDLDKAEALAIEENFLLSVKDHFLDWRSLIEAATRTGALRHIDPKTPHDGYVLVWAFSVVRKREKILSYRNGRYRDDRDAFANRKSIGFAEIVSYENQTLFNDDFGIADCGLRTVMYDLDLSYSAFSSQIVKPVISFAAILSQAQTKPAMIFVLEWECPDWFEPTARRLSLNDLRWIDLNQRPNDAEAFEPVSALALEGLIQNTRHKCNNASN
ncbi:HTH domain-containing protein [Methylobacterium sp. 1030]|uniref:HTH domain-containing protein n=1 Tax=Methylobacterium sp. 1030 TaxID=3156404 RepID=UPI00339A738B